jgi:putative ABC transport system permease protein
MSYLECLWTGLSALRVNRMRSVLTMLGIVIGVAAVICMMSIALGAEADVAEKIRTLGTNLLLIRPGAQMSGAARLAAGTAHTLTEEDALSIRHEVPDVQAAAPLLSHSVRLVAGDKNWTSLAAGIDGDYLVAREWRVESGRAFTGAEFSRGDKVAIVGFDIVTQLFEGNSPLGENVRIDDVPFTIIGVLEKKGPGPAGISQDDVVFVTLSAAKTRVLGAVRGSSREAMDFILVKVADPQFMTDVANDVAKLLRQRHRLTRNSADDFTVQNPSEVLAARQDATRTFGMLLLSVASVSLAVGGVSIMNIMLVSVTERTREIGLRMAVGARRLDIRLQFLFEAVVLVLIGGLLGSIAGCAAASVIAWQAGWPVVIGPTSILLACGFALAVGVIFGFYPAHRASRLDPIVALRAE